MVHLIILTSGSECNPNHRAPFAGNYCIVSGWWNPLLDGSGFFGKLERVVYDATVGAVQVDSSCDP
jgi:hypothetical protein